MIDGIICRIRTAKLSEIRTRSTTFSILTNDKMVFELRKKSKLGNRKPNSHFLKTLGFRTEAQTGDEEFDSLVCIAADNPAVIYFLQNNTQARDLIKKLFSNKCDYIESNGILLSCTFPGNKSENKEFAELLTRLYLQMKADAPVLKLKFKDRFGLRIVLVESLVWALGAYGGLSFALIFIDGIDSHFWFFPIVTQGLFAAFFCVIFLLTLVIVLLRKSARGPNIFFIALYVSVLFIPAGPIQFIADYNIVADNNPSIYVEAIVTKLYQSEIYVSNKSRVTRHYVKFEPASPSEVQKIPDELWIDAYLYRELQVGKKIRLEIGPGRLHHPWLKHITH